MTGSSMTLESQFSDHPVHRATALLRQALYSSTSPTPDPAEVWSAPLFRLEPAPIELVHGPIAVTGQDDPLAALLAPAAFDAYPECQAPVTDRDDGSAAPASEEDAVEGEDVLDHAVQVQLQGLVQAFHQRQRQASLLVACSIAAAIVLTLGGLIFLFSVTSPAPGGPEKAAPKDGTSVNRSASRAPIAEPTLAPIRVASTLSNTSDTKVIQARPGRPLALGPLLPLGVARYVLLRGLPEDALLSAGRRTGADTWMVKGEDIGGLTLTFGDAARGDYPTEIYLLDTDDGPQARRRLILRVDPSPQIYAAGLALGWPRAFSAEPKPAEQSETKPAEQAEMIAPAEMAALHDRAQTLLTNGDVATARSLLTELAKRGEASAAYELGLTYDNEVLERAGLERIEGDMATAQEWYTRAAQAGHAGATRRLEMIARGRAGA